MKPYRLRRKNPKRGFITKRKQKTKKATPNKIKNFFGKWKLLVIVSITALGIVVDYFGLIDLLKSDKELFINEKYVKGVLLPPELSFMNEIEFRCAGFSTLYDKRSLTTGIKYPIENASNIDIHFILKDNRIYTSLDFYSINDGNYIGKLNYKHWNLVKQNILDYNESDNIFEIIDNMNNVVFRLAYEYPNIINIEGYQISNNSVYVFNETSTHIIPIQDKQSAITEIKKIKRKIF